MTWISRVLARLRAPVPPITDEELAVLRERTESGLAQDQARDAEVHAIARRLRLQREQNHFGPLIWAAIRGEPHV